MGDFMAEILAEEVGVLRVLRAAAITTARYLKRKDKWTDEAVALFVIWCRRHNKKNPCDPCSKIASLNGVKDPDLLRRNGVYVRERAGSRGRRQQQRRIFAVLRTLWPPTEYCCVSPLGSDLFRPSPKPQAKAKLELEEAVARSLEEQKEAETAAEAPPKRTKKTIKKKKKKKSGARSEL